MEFSVSKPVAIKHKIPEPVNFHIKLPNIEGSMKAVNRTPDRINSPKPMACKKLAGEDHKKRHQYTVRELVLETQLQADKKMRKALQPYLSGLPPTSCTNGSAPASPLLLRIKEVSQARLRKGAKSPLGESLLNLSELPLQAKKKHIESYCGSRSQEDLHLLLDKSAGAIQASSDQYEVLFVNHSVLKDSKAKELQSSGEDRFRSRHASKEYSYKGLQDYSAFDLQETTKMGTESKHKLSTCEDYPQSETRSSKVLRMIAKRAEQRANDSKKDIGLPGISPKAINFHVRREGKVNQPGNGQPPMMPRLLCKNSNLKRAETTTDSRTARAYIWDDQCWEGSKKRLPTTDSKRQRASKGKRKSGSRERKSGSRERKSPSGSKGKFSVKSRGGQRSKESKGKLGGVAGEKDSEYMMVDTGENATSYPKISQYPSDFSTKNKDRVLLSKLNISDELQLLDTSINASSPRDSSQKPQIMKSWLEGTPTPAVKLSARLPNRQRVSVRSIGPGQKDSESQSTKMVTYKHTRDLQSEKLMLSNTKPTAASQMKLLTNHTGDTSGQPSARSFGPADPIDAVPSPQVAPLLSNLSQQLQRIRENNLQPKVPGAGKRSMLVSNAQLLHNQGHKEETLTPIPFTTREDRKSTSTLKSEIEGYGLYHAGPANSHQSHLPQQEYMFAQDCAREVASDYFDNMFAAYECAHAYTAEMFESVLAEMQQMTQKVFMPPIVPPNTGRLFDQPKYRIVGEKKQSQMAEAYHSPDVLTDVDLECAEEYIKSLEPLCDAEVDQNLPSDKGPDDSVLQFIGQMVIDNKFEPVPDSDIQDAEEFVNCINDWAANQLAIRDTLAAEKAKTISLLGAALFKSSKPAPVYPIKISVPPCRLVLEHYRMKLLTKRENFSRSEASVVEHKLKRQNTKTRSELLKEANYGIRLTVLPCQIKTNMNKKCNFKPVLPKSNPVEKSVTCELGEFYAGTGLTFFSSYISKSHKSKFYSARSGRSAHTLQSSIKDEPKQPESNPWRDPPTKEDATLGQALQALAAASAQIYLVAPPEDLASRSSFARNPRSILRGKNTMQSGSHLGSFSSSHKGHSPVDLKIPKGLSADSGTISGLSYKKEYDNEIRFLKQQGDVRAENIYRERNNLFKSNLNSTKSSRVEEAFQEAPCSSYEKSEFEMDFKPPRKMKGFDPSKHEFSNDDNLDAMGGDNGIRRKAANMGMSAIANLQGFDGAKNKFENANDPFSQFKMVRLGNGPYDFLIQDFEDEDDFQHLVMGDEKAVKSWSEDTNKVLHKQSKQKEATADTKPAKPVLNAIKLLKRVSSASGEHQVSSKEVSANSETTKQQPVSKAIISQRKKSESKGSDEESESSSEGVMKKSRLIISNKPKRLRKPSKSADEDSDSESTPKKTISGTESEREQEENSSSNESDEDSSGSEEEDAEESGSGQKYNSKSKGVDKNSFIMQKLEMYWDGTGIRGMQASYVHDGKPVPGKLHGSKTEESSSVEIMANDRCYEIWCEIGDKLIKCLKFILGRGDTIRIGPDDYDSRTRVYNYSIKRRKLSRVYAGFSADGYLVCLAFKLVKARL